MIDSMNRLELVNEALREALLELIGRMEWIEKHKPDMWFRTGFGVWALCSDMSDPEAKRYEAPTLEEAIDLAMADKDEWE